MKKTEPKSPWRMPKPKGSGGKKLTAAEIQMARERAAKAGRRYPNLVDNMAVLKLRKVCGELP